VINLIDSRAIPMSKALQGEFGTTVAADYRGEPVLAAYEPLPVLGLGIVAKIDIAEIRAPFIRAGLVALVISLFIVAIGVALFTRLSHRILRRLEESESNYRAIVEDQTELVCRLDSTGVLLFVNQAYCRFFNQLEQQLIGQAFVSMIPLEERQKSIDAIALLSSSTPLSMVEHRVIMADGATRWLQWTYRAISDAGDRLVVVQAVGREVSEQKAIEFELRNTQQQLEQRVALRTQELTQTNAALEAEIDERKLMEDILRRNERELTLSEQRYKQLFMETGAVGLLVDMETTGIIAANQMASAYYGFTTDQLKTMNMTDLIVDSSEWIAAATVEARQSMRSRFFTKHRLACGSVREVQVNVSRLEVQDKRLFYVIVKDISDELRAESARKASDERLRALLDHSPDSIMMVDVQGVVLFANRDWGGRSIDEIVGQNLEVMLPGSHRVRYQKALLQVFSKAVPDQFDWMLSDGTFLQTRLVPICNGDRVASAMLTTTDTTEKRILQAQTLKSARLVTLGILSASVAHEINNPNSSIQFSNALLSSAWQDALPILRDHAHQNGEFSLAGLSFSEMEVEIPILAQRVASNVERIKTIVSSLKHLVREDSEFMDQKVDLVRVIEDSISVLANKIQQYTDAFRVELPQNLPMVIGNAQQLEQVLINIILNALQSLTKRDACVLVTASKDEASHELIIQVKDQGCGILAENIVLVTEPLFTTKQKSGGTGLGLSIAQRIVVQHRGKLLFESISDEGTLVTLRLPYEHIIEQVPA